MARGARLVAHAQDSCAKIYLGEGPREHGPRPRAASPPSVCTRGGVMDHCQLYELMDINMMMSVILSVWDRWKTTIWHLNIISVCILGSYSILHPFEVELVFVAHRLRARPRKSNLSHGSRLPSRPSDCGGGRSRRHVCCQPDA